MRLIYDVAKSARRLPWHSFDGTFGSIYLSRKRGGTRVRKQRVEKAFGVVYTFPDGLKNRYWLELPSSFPLTGDIAANGFTGEGLLRAYCNRGIDGSDGRQKRPWEPTLSRPRSGQPLALLSTCHALIVRRRAPWNFNDNPSFHSASIMANRSVCSTAPATLMRASIRP